VPVSVIVIKFRCKLKMPEDLEIDGQSLAPLLHGEIENWPDRTLFVQNQRVEYPVKRTLSL